MIKKSIFCHISILENSRKIAIFLGFTTYREKKKRRKEGFVKQKLKLHLYQNQKGSSLYHIQQKQMPSVNWEERKLGRMNHVAHRRHLLLLNMVQGAAFLVLIEVVQRQRFLPQTKPNHVSDCIYHSHLSHGILPFSHQPPSPLSKLLLSCHPPGFPFSTLEG